MQRSRFFKVGVVLGILGSSALGSWAAEYAGSVYVESMAALQKQSYEAAQGFAIPELGMVPMMMSMTVPGAAQLKQDAPIGVHVFIRGTEAPPVVVGEVTPALSPEALLQALTMRMGLPLPEPVDGRYVTSEGVAQVMEDRVLLAQSEGDLDAALVAMAEVPPAMPDIDGLLRLVIKPSSLTELMMQAKGMMASELDAMPEDDRAMMLAMLDFYMAAYAQIETYEQGVGIQPEGLVVRSRVMAVPGSTVEQILRSVEPVSEAWGAELDRDIIFGMAAGAYEVPASTMELVMSFYMNLYRQSGVLELIDAEKLEQMLAMGFATLGDPLFTVGQYDEASKQFQFYGGVRADDARGLLAQAMDMMPTYKELMKQSGIHLTGPVKRDVAGQPVYRWSADVDKDGLKATVARAGNTDVAADDVVDEAVKAMERVLAYMGTDYDYAATESGLVFGSGGDAVIVQALSLLDQDKAEAPIVGVEQLKAVVQPTAPLSSLGRFNWAKVLDIARSIAVEFDAPVDQIPAFSGTQGLWFAGWVDDGSYEQALLLPADDIRAISQTLRGMVESGTPE